MTNLKRISILALSVLLVLTVFNGTVVQFGTATDDTTEGIALVTVQSIWKYLDNGTDPAGSGERTSWTEIDFDDSGWKTSSGNAKFGAKAGQLAQLDGNGVYVPEILLNHYQADGTCVPTYFFRTSFTLDSLPAAGTALVGTVHYDDAAIVYINGTKVADINVPDGGYSTNLEYGCATTCVDPAATEFVADASVLRVGENVIAVEVHNQRNNSSDIYFSMPELALEMGKPEYLTMNVGSNETERNFTWYFMSEDGAVQFAERNGDTFPENYTTVKSTVTAHNGTYIHRATITGLKPDTEYVYRIASGSVISSHYYFETDPADSFNFIFVGDPQIGASWGADDNDDISGWAATLSRAESMFPNTSILVSAGDQVETSTNESHYAGFLSPDTLSSLAIATTVGNHDTTALLYSEHYNNPNTTINGVKYGTTEAGGDYWYTYNNTLFMHLNHNNKSIAEHRTLMEYAIAQNPDVTWKVVVVHFAYFGAGPYYMDTQYITPMREAITPVFDELDIDVVLAGHEHAYARSYMVDYTDSGLVIDNQNGVPTSVTDPEGIFYITGASSSGSKYYGIMTDAQSPHVAAKLSHTTTFSNVEVDENSFKITTYRSEDGSVVDTFEIIKDKKLVPSEPKVSDNLLLYKDYDIPETDNWLANLTDGVAVDSMTWNKSDWYSFEYGKNTDGEAAVTFDLGKTENIGTIRMHLLGGGTSGVAAGIIPPKKIEAFISDDGINYTSIGEIPLVAVSDPEPEYHIYWTALNIENGAEGRYLQIRVTHTGEWGHVMINEIEAYSSDHTHIAENGWKTYEDNHWQECSCGERLNSDAHSGEWVTVTEAKVGVAGKKENKCTVCGYVIATETIPALEDDKVDDPGNGDTDPGNGDTDPVDYVLGDVNKTGEIDMMDYILLKRNYFGTFNFDEDQLKRGDCNKSGEIDMMDYILLKRAYFGTFVLQ